MNALELHGIRRAVIVAPHPDDETIGAFGLICALRAGGATVEVVVVTDGAASHRHSPQWPAQRLRRQRRRESLKAMRRAGLAPAALRFLDFPDGGLGERNIRQLAPLARAIGRGPRPDLLVLPSRRDDHPDHRAVARAGARAWRGPLCALSYLVWPQDRADQGEDRRYRLPLSASQQALKRTAIRDYRTQTGGIDDDPEGFCLTPDMIARFSRSFEYFGSPS